MSLKLYNCLFATNAGPAFKYFCSSKKEITFEMGVLYKVEEVPLHSPASSKYPWAFWPNCFFFWMLFSPSPDLLEEGRCSLAQGDTRGPQ